MREDGAGQMPPLPVEIDHHLANQILPAPNVPTVGASGAIYGLFGATFVAARRLRLDIRWLVGLIAINLVLTFAVPGISWQGHIGGLITYADYDRQSTEVFLDNLGRFTRGEPLVNVTDPERGY